MYHSSSSLSGNKRKEPENLAESNYVPVAHAFEPGRRGNTKRKVYTVRSDSTTTSEKEEKKEVENEKEMDAKRITQILEELPSKDADGVVDCMNELANLMYPTTTNSIQSKDLAESNAKHLYELGGHGLILHCLRALTNNCRAQTAGMVALQNLTCSLFEDALYDSLAKAGAVKVIINAMIQFPDYQTQKAGCGVLLNVSGGPLTVKQTILREGGVACICSTMKNHPDCKKIQIRGCGVLRTLKVDLSDETNDAIWKAKGVSSVVGALENHPDDAELPTLHWKDCLDRYI